MLLLVNYEGGQLSTLAARIREARREAGYSQERFAKALGVDPRTARRWERPVGANRPRETQMRRIAEVTGRPYAWFHADDDEPVEAARPSHGPQLTVEEALGLFQTVLSLACAGAVAQGLAGFKSNAPARLVAEVAGEGV
jgi:transcriptional regulator with XRE-family HTH domain